MSYSLIYSISVAISPIMILCKIVFRLYWMDVSSFKEKKIEHFKNARHLPYNLPLCKIAARPTAVPKAFGIANARPAPKKAQLLL